MPLNIACFIAICQPSDILLSPLALPSPTEFPAFQFPTPSSDINCRKGVDERFSLHSHICVKTKLNVNVGEYRLLIIYNVHKIICMNEHTKKMIYKKQ
jgi:hypothetical protein